MSILSSIFRRTKASELVLIFDIGSSSVGGALVELHSDKVPNILLSIREPILLEPETTFDRFFFLTLKSVEIVAEKLSKSGHGSPRKIYCVLSSPWYASQTRAVILEKETPFLVNASLHDDLLKKEIALFQEEYLAKYGHPNEKVRSLEIKTIRTKLNGYETTEPLNQKARIFEMTLFISLSPELVLNRIGESINRHFHLRKIKFSSFVMASFVVARDIFAHQENFLLIDLGGEVTDISMVKKSVLRESISFPMGTNFMVRGIAEGMHTSLEEAKSILAIYKDGHAVGTLEQKLEPIINYLKESWLKKFQESLANLSNDISIPSNIFLSIDKEYAELFKNIIKTEQFNQYTLTESKFEVSFLGTEALSGNVSFGGGVERDPFIIIPAIYISRLFN